MLLQQNAFKNLDEWMNNDKPKQNHTSKTGILNFLIVIVTHSSNGQTKYKTNIQVHTQSTSLCIFTIIHTYTM